MRTALLTAVSHDLRAPLAAARASVDTLRDPRFELSETDRGDLLGAAGSSLGRLSRLVEDLLDMSRLQTGALQPRLEPVAAGEVIPRAVDDVPAAEGRITVAPIPDAVPPALADGALLERVLANLVGNAAKHTTSRIEVTAGLSAGVSAGLTAGLGAGLAGGLTAGPTEDPTEPAGGDTVGERGERVEIRVIDHGPGIPAADRDRVFRPFQRLGDRDNTAGVGLGLALARGLTEAMGGELWPEDTPGGGLTMVVAIPARSGAGTAKGAAR
ncbi:sensor histidine kinase [Catenulispora pinisilvae]|uniref:sensor histidine kinase n=1 Tax=Catenulispora pinisilvae TaxID=2705253 RepID=UPI003F69F2DF